jgi:hypothetical protein
MIRVIVLDVLRRPRSSVADRSAAVDAADAGGGAVILAWLENANSMLAGLPAHLAKRLQSVLNAAARLIYGLRRYDHVSDALITLHRLRIPEVIQFKLAVHVPRIPHGNAPSYLGPLHFDCLMCPGRSPLRSASSHRLIDPPVHRSPIRERAFSMSGPTVWNSYRRTSCLSTVYLSFIAA